MPTMRIRIRKAYTISRKGYIHISQYIYIYIYICIYIHMYSKCTAVNHGWFAVVPAVDFQFGRP